MEALQKSWDVSATFGTFDTWGIGPHSGTTLLSSFFFAFLELEGPPGEFYSSSFFGFLEFEHLFLVFFFEFFCEFLEFGLLLGCCGLLRAALG